MITALPPASTSSPTPSLEQRAARARALFQATVIENKWIPETVKAGLLSRQVEFLCFEGREALYGGAGRRREAGRTSGRAAMSGESYAPHFRSSVASNSSRTLSDHLTFPVARSRHARSPNAPKT